MAEANEPLKKEAFFVSITKWKKEAVKTLATENAVNTSQLIENFLTQHFGEELERFRPEKDERNQAFKH